MQYWLSLPRSWKPAKSWAVVVVIESADRKFKETAEAFVRTRGAMPFIIVAPLVTTNGGPSYKESGAYPYTDAIFDEIAKDRWKFDTDGIAAAVADVHRDFGGEEKYYLTGWEAGGHTVWAMAFDHPELLAAVAPVCPNYASRYVKWSSDPSRSSLPIRFFVSDGDPGFGPGSPIFSQCQRAVDEGRSHGFKVSQKVVPGDVHGPLPGPVLAWFDSLR